jgi:hypothetical protein
VGFIALGEDKKAKLTAFTDQTLNTAEKFNQMYERFSKMGHNIPPHLTKQWKNYLNKNTDIINKDISAYLATADKKDPANKAFEAQISKKIGRISEISKKLGALDSIATPPDTYKDSDKADLTKKIKQEWKSRYPKDEIVGIRFAQPSWTKRKERRYNSVNKAWYPLDISTLEVKLITKKDADTLYINPIFLLKDHLKSDELEIDVETAKSPMVRLEIPKKNYKP